ncbi:PiggyBac transposable element-derived protein 3 [Trichinella murrelli]|uniref:PiggyBac transposable element-derived protein 3 n=1 Tax=Trichinella murrelli TaxID=144512 RepID=A0A0V0T3L0_9BILA|nr:PiggyBac transposable element-derived protein 3 [Trichinella murrelli]
MYVCRWNDNTAVTIAFNYYTHFPVGTVRRFSRAVKKHVDVAEPNIIRQYNKYMGGVDVMDKINRRRMLPETHPRRCGAPPFAPVSHCAKAKDC